MALLSADTSIQVTLPKLNRVPNAPIADDEIEGNYSLRHRSDRLEINAGRQMNRLTFHVPNFPRIYGDWLKDEGCEWSGRSKLVSDSWAVLLDVRPHSRDIERELRQRGGHSITHTGELRRTDGASFDVAEAREGLALLRTVLSFTAGRWVTPILPVGFAEDDEPVWTEWSAYRLNSWRGAHMAIDQSHPESLTELFKHSANLSADPFRRDVLHNAIDYYVDGTRPDPVQLAVSTLQAGLELLAWTELVEEAGVLTPDEYSPRRRAAHQNLTDLLVRRQISIDVPSSLPALREAADSAACQSGPEILTRMRNGVIHPRRGRRSFTFQAWIEAWKLAQQYLLLGILAYLGYEGVYRNPVSESKWLGEVEGVPWAVASSDT